MRTVEYSETMVGDHLGIWSTARRSTLNCQTPQTGFEEIAARTAVGSTAFPRTELLARCAGFSVDETHPHASPFGWCIGPNRPHRTRFQPPLIAGTIETSAPAGTTVASSPV